MSADGLEEVRSVVAFALRQLGDVDGPESFAGQIDYLVGAYVAQEPSFVKGDRVMMSRASGEWAHGAVVEALATRVRVQWDGASIGSILRRDAERSLLHEPQVSS